MKYLTLLFVTITFLTNQVFARGCCSHHGGINNCGINGYCICNDGTQSPSCTCSYYQESKTTRKTTTRTTTNKKETSKKDDDSSFTGLLAIIMSGGAIALSFSKKK